VISEEQYKEIRERVMASLSDEEKLLLERLEMDKDKYGECTAGIDNHDKECGPL